MKKILLIVGITLVMLFGCELVARVVLWRSTAREQVQVAFGFSRSGSGDLLPNIDSIERLFPTRPYWLRTNSVGLRNEAEVNDDPAVTRILAIGDSYTYGFYVHNPETFPARLEERLNERLPNDFQVLNAGIPGYTIADELSYLQEKGLALNPDVVILGVYMNDIFDLSPTMRQYFAREVMLTQASPATALTQVNPLRDWLRDNVALYNGWQQWRAGFTELQIQEQVAQAIPNIPGMQEQYLDITYLNPSAHQELWQEYERLLREMIALLQERDIPLVIVVFPDLGQYPAQDHLNAPFQDLLQKITSETNTPYLDMLPVLQATGGDIATVYLMYYDPRKTPDPNAPGAGAGMYSGDGHLSVYGNLVTGRALAELLIEQGLVPTVAP